MVERKRRAAAGAQAAPDSRAPQADEIFETEACWSISSGDLLCLHTGDWRTERPIFVKEKCNACGFCYIYCPIQCVVDDEDGIHYAGRHGLLQGLRRVRQRVPQGRDRHDPRRRLRR